jgi:hypothetical protein
MLAVISALKEWRCFLEGCRDSFTRATDHQPLVYPDTCTANNPHTGHLRARWLSAGCGYNYKNGVTVQAGSMLQTQSPGLLNISNTLVIWSQWPLRDISKAEQLGPAVKDQGEVPIRHAHSQLCF